MTWPDGSWAFTRLLGDGANRALANTFCILAAAGFVIGGFGVLFGQPWWRVATIASATLSAVLYILFWNGRAQHLDRQGGIAILIDVAILLVVLLFQKLSIDL